MSRKLRLNLRLLVSILMSLVATAAIGVGSVFADGGGPPFPR
ncbi:MAG: hypothetical protein ABSC46_10380 [Candidatus Limnocylindrales bacterium]|jgi:hypothetical protein